ncbi:hypothetical protein AC482_02775 [miscellaneous Crenarchaeota group-15 archaeon DG-45]|uniref:Transcription factor NikR nickel binding C-terminal domain-containing protein n=1 Tax=miscellaneous Crenarchaeota group-15 archaeon DG-45 TaxID=1685127 RepID=A0A0M0BQM0_9ARCH|nr:MAG: hypothetical protein AC482_02775 [miscellaneous Crenarchaeota group-15 archaeon DG-45]
MTEEIAAVRHGFRGVISSVQQRYVEENKVLEVVGVEGDAGEIKRLTQELMALKGVKQVKASIISP